MSSSSCMLVILPLALSLACAQAPSAAPDQKKAASQDAAPAPAPGGGPHVLVLKDGTRVECAEVPVAAMGRVMFKSLDGVTHAISDKLVDLEATRTVQPPAPAPAAAKPQAAPAPQTADSSRKRPPTPDFEAVRPDGTKVRLSDLKGKVVLVDFWATWCGPCMREMPHVKAAHAKLAGANFEIMGVSLDHDRERLDSYLKSQGIAWPQYFDGKGWGNAVAREWGVNSIPMAVLLDKEGQVAAVGLRGADLEFKVAELIGK